MIGSSDANSTTVVSFDTRTHFESIEFSDIMKQDKKISYVS